MRRVKYTLGTDGIHFLLVHTSLLDGSGQPPPFINYSGAGDFVAIGDFIVQRLIDKARLEEGHAVLEIGCGIGRNATALARRMHAIRYCGFDIVAYGITWCSKHFGNRKNFLFSHADIHNSFYNPRGSLQASQFTFGYRDDEFDIVFATSVFTHMPATQVARYLAESSRCLKPGGLCYFTCFILDEDSRQNIEAGSSVFSFRNAIENAWTERVCEPDVAVAFEAGVFLEMVTEAGLRVVSFEPGEWRGGGVLADFQDSFVLEKAA